MEKLRGKFVVVPVEVWSGEQNGMRRVVLMSQMSWEGMLGINEWA